MRLLLAWTVIVAAGCAENHRADLPTDASTASGLDASSNPPTCTLAGVDPKCGATCATDTDCSATLFCSSLHCAAECVAGSATCGAGWTCGARGHCVFLGGGADAGDCPRVDVKAAEQVPTVMLLIDQSGSMTNDFNGTSRWDAVRKALTDPQAGVVTKLQAKVIFGATLYTGVAGTCPKLTVVDPAINNAKAIDDLLANHKPANDTPTGEALAPTAQKLHDGAVESSGPRLVVLATDGAPDTCAVPNPKDAQQQQAANDVAVNAARVAYALGIETIILSVGSQTVQAHLQEMANAGKGVVAGTPDAPFYVATSPAEMVKAFDDIIRGARVCTFSLSGSVVPGQESTGSVLLDGKPLSYGDANGWKLKDARTLELTGTACTSFKQSDASTLSASFACGSVIN